MIGLATPNLTAAQLLAVAKDALAVAIAFGAPLNQTQQVALLALAGTSTVILLAADAWIRGNRSKHVAGPLIDKAAADTILSATIAARAPVKPVDPIRAATGTAAQEAALEQAARNANDAAPAPVEAAPGVDPATL